MRELARTCSISQGVVVQDVGIPTWQLVSLGRSRMCRAALILGTKVAAAASPVEHTQGRY
jgi:hypothetical protein